MIDFLLAAGLGALMQELAHWYELRKKFSTKRVQSLFRSKEYWLITFLMIFLTPICCWILFGQGDSSPPMQFISGAAFPLFFKKLVSSFASKDQIPLGPSSISDYFQLYSFTGK